MKKHYEIILIVKGGAPVRKNLLRANIVEAITSAIESVPGAVVADVEGAHCCGGEIDE